MVYMHSWPIIFTVAVCNFNIFELTFYFMCFVIASLLLFTFTRLKILDLICHRYGLFHQAFAL